MEIGQCVDRWLVWYVTLEREWEMGLCGIRDQTGMKMKGKLMLPMVVFLNKAHALQS